MKTLTTKIAFTFILIGSLASCSTIKNNMKNNSLAVAHRWEKKQTGLTTAKISTDLKK